ncbi:YicC family protein [Candidatus Dependentiae bacterium]|nr:YicC family protein [Candidatus Dependentiae bacterium]
MIRSMTGFASKIIQLTLSNDSKSNITINLKSLNSRYFETNCRIPYALSSIESELTKLFKEKLLRGSIYCTIHMSNPQIFKSSIEASMPVAQGYVDAVDDIKKKFKIEGNLDIATLLSLPNIFIVSDQGVDEESKKVIIDTINELIENLIAVQTKEGEGLRDDLKQRVEIATKEINDIEVASKKAIEEQKKKIHETLAELGSDESRFAEIKKSALYAILDKIDIHEEIVRFKSHLVSLHAQLDSDKIEKGKRLDFTLQELGREINTIAAKCSDAAIGSMAINVKVELEKAREQTQNIL